MMPVSIKSNEPSNNYNKIYIPPEVLVEILKRSDYRAVLSTRQTCRTFYQITTTKTIWISLFWQSVHNSPPKTFALEKPMDAYSSKELERIVLAYESTKVAWRTDDGVPSRQQRIVINRYVDSVYLVPGGRWLLGVFSDGYIGYHDLESQGQIEEKELVPAQVPESSLNILKTSMCISNTLSITSFNLAVYLRESRHKTYNGIKVWKIELVVEGLDVIGLKATCVKTIPMDQQTISHLVSISLLDRHLAFSAKGLYDVPSATFVIEWPDIVDGSLDFPRKHIASIGKKRREMHLLRNQKIISVYWELVEVIDYSTVPDTRSVTERPPSSAWARQIWKYELQYPTNLSLPLPSWDDDRIGVLALTSDVLYDINITDMDQPFSPSHISVVPLMPTPAPSQIYPYIRTGADKDGAAHGLAHQRGVLYGKFSPDLLQLHLLEYQTGVETPEFVPVAKMAKYSGNIIQRPHFDPGSGRLVACFDGHFEVIDFALIYKDS